MSKSKTTTAIRLTKASAPRSTRDMKTMVEAKLETLDERLKRLERLIDTLQSSVLRKVGDYVTNVEDLKHEMIETQKTFAKVLGSKHHEHKK